MPIAASPPDAERLPPLPMPGGPARAVLMLVRPRLLFLHWARDADLDAALARATGPAELVIDASSDGASFREIERRPFDFGAPAWYVANEAVDAFVRVRLAIQDRGAARDLLVSNVVRVPRERPGTAPGAPMDRAAPGIAAAHGAAATPQPVSSPSGPVGWGAPPARPAPARGRIAGEAAAGASGDLAIVLHAHLPFVRQPERAYFQEEHWLFEAITETYLPLLDAFEHLAEDRVPVRLTMSLTATLMAMLRDPGLVAKYERHLERMCDLARREVARTRRDPDFGPLAGFYHDRLERLRHLFVREYGRDLVGQFARLERRGLLEIVACAATHGFLPHLALAPETAWAQIAAGVAEHQRQIGHAPRGFWLPECAYVEGLDALLAKAGVEYVFVDSHALRNASSPPRLGLHAPIVTPRGVAALARDEESSVQVWSAEQGYPGDPSYRDFYRDIGFDLDHAYVAPYLDPAGTRGMTGFKYHRITGRTDDKRPYRREAALRAAAGHAADFVANRRAQIDHLASVLDRRPLVVAMYDAELFGHWWFEGPEWLEAVLRQIPERGLRAISPGQSLDESPAAEIAEPSSSSWGAGGYYEVWLNATNDWIQPPLADAGRRMVALASRHAAAGGTKRRALAQAGRELLLAQASDWPFILKNGTTTEYAVRRVHEHLDRFDRLARQLEAGHVDEAGLERLEALDNLFPDLDPALWRSA